MFSLAFYFGAFIVIILTNWLYNWCNPKCPNGVLPPGSMGYPLCGETFEFFSPNTSSDISPFVKKRMQRYGPIFKTNLVGWPVIVSTDTDLNYFIFQQEGQLFELWYPYSFNQIFGRKNIGTFHGFMHKYLKNLVLNLFGQESLKRMLPEVERASNMNLERWARQATVDIKDAAAQMIFHLTARKLISYDSEKFLDDLRQNFLAFSDGAVSFPINLPGTAYNKCLRGRKNIMKMLRSTLEERRQNRRNTESDFFDYALQEFEREGTLLTEDIALDLMLVLLFASFETTSLAITSAIKFLVEHPLVLQALTDEHEAIIKRRQDKDSGLTWNEYKSMKFTFQFINETIRLAHIAPLIFRKALKDIKFKDYTIPAGWPVMVCPPAVHLDPTKYTNPLEFNPWRWEGIDTNRASRNFMAFGGGVRFCAGADFSKLQMAVFLHGLVTKYKWEPIEGGGDILRTPSLKFPNGYHIHITQKTQRDASQIMDSQSHLDG